MAQPTNKRSATLDALGTPQVRPGPGSVPPAPATSNASGALALALPTAQPDRRFLTNTDRGHVEAIRPHIERLHPGHRLDVGEPQPTAHVSLAALLLFGTVGIYLLPDPSKEA